MPPPKNYSYVELAADDERPKNANHDDGAETETQEEPEATTASSEPRLSVVANGTPATAGPAAADQPNGTAANTVPETGDAPETPDTAPSTPVVGVVGATVLAGTQPAADQAAEEEEEDGDTAPAAPKNRSLGQRAADIHQLIVEAKKKLAHAITARDMQLVMEASAELDAIEAEASVAKKMGAKPKKKKDATYVPEVDFKTVDPQTGKSPSQYHPWELLSNLAKSYRRDTGAEPVGWWGTRIRILAEKHGCTVNDEFIEDIYRLVHAKFGERISGIRKRAIRTFNAVALHIWRGAPEGWNLLNLLVSEEEVS